ncbi:hypothetical protein WG936_03690 [Corynebacterium sp. H127]|uniref:hypothetical protein n=1 Tax=Corynebacterium sp. H127 TaxID=3133418 RepID=UPI0030AC3B90
MKFIDRRKMNLGESSFWRGVNAGDVVKLAGHIYADPKAYGSLAPWDRARAEAVAAGMSSSKAVVCGLSAASLWGLPVLSYRGPTELILPGNRKPSARSKWPKSVVYRSNYLPEQAITWHFGVRVTTLARTVIDSARWHSFAQALAIADGFMNREAQARRVLQDELGTIGHTKGVSRVRRVVNEARSKIGSAAESWARAQLLESDIQYASLLTQQDFMTKGERFVVDMVLDGWLVIEVDGAIKYSGSYGPEELVLAEQVRRERELVRLGLSVFRVDWGMLREGRFIPELRDYLARASRRPLYP